MAGQLPWNPSHYEVVRDAASIHVPEEPQSFAPKWYFSKQELEYYSPSRKDGISHVEESHLRELYCSFLQELGMELKVPQVTIATAMMFCHRFYMRQSHAKNCWRIMATVCMFLACKAEETSRWLADVVVVAYKMTYKWDPSAPRRIRQKEVYDKQKELTLNGERFLLTTLAFDMNIEHPYKPLVGAIKRLEISDKELIKVAWNFVNDWLRTTLCLQYRPHYVAAGSLFLAAKICRVKLPKEKGQVWWMQFDVSPKHVEEVVQQMMALLDQYRKQAPSQSVAGKGTAPQPIAAKTVSSSPQSCTLSGSAVNIEMANDSVSSKYLGNEKKTCSDVPNPTPKETGPHCQANDSGSADSVVEDCEAEKSNLNASSKIVSVEGGNANKVDVNWEQSQQPIPGQITNLEPIAGKAKSGSPQLCTLSDSAIPSTVKAEGPIESVSFKYLVNEKQGCDDVPDPTLKEMGPHCQANDSAVEDSESVIAKMISVEGGSGNKIDLNRIRETFRKRKQDRVTASRKLEEDTVDDEMDSEAWIEKELEDGIKLESANVDNKRQRL